jgi:hypothetical protein
MEKKLKNESEETQVTIFVLITMFAILVYTSSNSEIFQREEMVRARKDRAREHMYHL